jgi:hypothetical protein
MKYVRPASFAVAIAFVAVTVASLDAQTSQSAAQGTAPAQGPVDVNVVNVPTITIGSALQPIPVKGPVKEPVYLNFELHIVQPYSISGENALYAIPSGKQLTIEHTSLLCASDTLQEAYGAVIANGAALSYFPTHSFPIENGTSSKSVGAAALSATVTSGNISVFAGRSTSIGKSSCYMTVVGYLTPLQ